MKFLIRQGGGFHSKPISTICRRRIIENGHVRKEQLCTYNKSSCATIRNFSSRWTCYFLILPNSKLSDAANNK